MSKRFFLTVFCFSSSVILASLPAKASLIAYEGFNYSVGTIGSGSGTPTTGFGLTGNWQSQSSTDNIQNGSLSFGNISTTGNSVNHVSPGGKFEGPSLINPVVGSVYISVLIRIDSFDSTFGFSNALISVQDSDADEILFGAAYDNNQWSITDNNHNDVVSSGIAAQLGIATLLVLKITPDANPLTSDIRLFVISTPGAEPALADATYVPDAFLSFHIDGISKINIGQGVFDSQASFDEIRVGTTWADVVTTVPEPSSALFLGCGCLSLLGIRRRKTH